MVGDTRRFAHPHVHANFDFDGVRGIDTSLRVHIPGPFAYCGRDVCHQGRRFELWSPNSSKTPVYPGTKPSGFSLVPPLTHRRVDGSGGRFDWTLIPQYLDRKALHHPFIRDPERADGSVPEFTYLTAVWQSLREPSTGCLSRVFYNSLLDRAAMLEKNRLKALDCLPSHLQDIATLVSDAPTQADIQHFGGELDWDTCVESITHIQRLLREKAGWLRMLRLLQSSKWHMGHQGIENIVPVNDNVLGAWINGGDEDILQWFLQIGVPCYIIHEYRHGVDFGYGVPETRSRYSSNSFSLPIIWHLRDDVNAYEAMATRHQTLWSTEHPALPYGQNVISSPELLARSSSHFHGYSRPTYNIFQQPEPEDEDIVWPSVIVFSDRIPWLKPPPIAAVDKVGPWTRFAVATLEAKGHPLDGRDVMQQRGKKFKKDDFVGPYYDRKNKRQLYFESLPRVSGLVSAGMFGRPVPFYHFIDTTCGKFDPKTVIRSEWMYYSAEPESSDIGKEPPLPIANELPVYRPIPTASDSYMDDDDDDDDDFPRICNPSSALDGLVPQASPIRDHCPPQVHSPGRGSRPACSSDTSRPEDAVHQPEPMDIDLSLQGGRNVTGLSSLPTQYLELPSLPVASPDSSTLSLKTTAPSFSSPAVNAEISVTQTTQSNTILTSVPSDGYCLRQVDDLVPQASPICDHRPPRVHSPGRGSRPACSPDTRSEDAVHLPEPMDIDLSLEAGRDVTGLSSLPTQHLELPSLPVASPDSSMLSLKTTPPSFSSPAVNAEISVTQTTQSNTILASVPSDGYCLRQVSAEHRSTPQQSMETDQFFSPAQAETHDGDKNLDVVPVHKVSLPAQSSKSPPYNTTDTLDISGQVEMPQVVFRNLPSGTTIDDVAKRLRAPPREGGCGVSILASAAIPPWDSVSFVVQFESLHEARIARLGWNSLALGSSSAMPAPQSLLSTVILTPYRPKTANTFVDPSHRRFTSTHNHRTPIPALQSHHPGPYSVPSRAYPNIPASQSHHPGPYSVPSRAHRNYLGYMRRKGLIPRQN